jgi:hypothetical protein
LKSHCFPSSSASITVQPPTPSDLPELLRLSRPCERCYVNKQCILLAASDDTDVTLRRTHGPLLQHFTGHLNKVELEYFRAWDRLIDLEAHVSNHNVTKAWLMSSMERERSTGKCISSLALSDVDNQQHPLFEQYKGDKDSFIIKLERSTDSEISTPLNTLKLDVGSRVVLSSDSVSLYQLGEKQNFGILRGSVKAVEIDSIYIRVGDADCKRITRIKTAAPNVLRFRLDKDEFTAGTGTLRQNLMNLFTADIPPFTGKQGLTQDLLISIHDRTKARLPQLRRSIIHLDAPTFNPSALGDLFCLSGTNHINGCNLRDLSQEFQELNIDQKAAIHKVSFKKAG